MKFVYSRSNYRLSVLNMDWKHYWLQVTKFLVRSLTYMQYLKKNE